jgi:hypothetical protein
MIHRQINGEEHKLLELKLISIKSIMIKNVGTQDSLQNKQKNVKQEIIKESSWNKRLHRLSEDREVIAKL